MRTIKNPVHRKLAVIAANDASSSPLVLTTSEVGDVAYLLLQNRGTTDVVFWTTETEPDNDACIVIQSGASIEFPEGFTGKIFTRCTTNAVGWLVALIDVLEKWTA